MVASAVGGIVDIVKHEKTGLLVPEKDPHALAEAITRILTDEDLYVRLAREGYDFARKNFSEDAVADKVVGIYRELIKSRS